MLDGHVRGLPGGVDEYMSLAAQLREKNDDDVAAVPDSAPKTKDAAKERVARKDMARIERKMEKIRQQIERIGLKQADVAASGDFEALADLGKEAAAAQDELDSLEDEWMVAAEEAERWG